MAIVLEEGENVIDFLMNELNRQTNGTLIPAHKTLIRETIMDYASMSLSDVATCRKEVSEWANLK